MQTNQVTHRQVLTFLWRYMRHHKLLLACMLFMLGVSTALQLTQPFFYKAVVDRIASGDAVTPEALHFLISMVLFGVLFGALHLTLHELAARMLGWIETRVMERAHSEVYAHAQKLSTQFHVNAFAGATTRKINRGTDALETMMDRLWFNFLPLITTTVGFVIVFALFAPLMGATLVSCVTLYSIVSVTLNVFQARYHSWTDRQDTRVTASLVDAIAGNAAVKLFGAEGREEARHGAVLREWRDRLWKTWGIGNIVTWIQFMLLMGIELLLLLLAIRLWSRGIFTAGSFVIVFAYIGRLWGHLFDIGQQVRNYLRAVAHAEEMVALFALPHDVADIPEASKLSVLQGAIVFDHITFSYEHAAKPVFRDFHLEIRPGEKVALVGHSGGGKSTFVKLLLRLYDVQEGRITIDGEDIKGVTQESLRRSVALVPQDPVLFHRSLAENIAYGKPDATLEEIERAAKLAHAHEFISTFPKGYDTLVGERGVKLSGGERQRVAIARAILADTPILVLDEATSSLDSQSEKLIQDGLEHLMEGSVPLASGSGTGRRRTTIAIAHRLSTIKKADRILVIEEGVIVEEGSHSELVKREGGIYRHFFELQAGGFIGE